MIFINHMKSVKAAKDYYTQHIAPGDYYTKDGPEMPGIWHGEGSRMLGLSGFVQKEDMFRLLENKNSQTGEQLTPRNKDDRRVMTDMTFDCPKAVSLVYELGGDERILDAFRQSVRETMGEIEGAVQTRVRKGGKDEDRTTGNLIWSENVHRTTRPVDGIPDPHLHIHAAIVNATFDEAEKRWKAVQLGDIVRDKGYYQAAFHARLAGHLKDLGYGIQRDGNSFTIAGISRGLVEEFSRRHAVINEEAKKRGITDKEARSKLVKQTREKKSDIPLSIEELRTQWHMRLTKEEREVFRMLNPYRTYENERIPEKAPGNAGDAFISPEQAKEYALAHSFQNASAVSEKRLKAEALAYGVGSVLPEDVADIAQHPEVIAETRGGQLMTTTKTVLANEVAMLQFAKDGQRKQQPFIPAQERTGIFEWKSADASRSGIYDKLAGLSNEQKKAALHILQSRDTVTGIVGKAGTGKTTMMRATRDALEGATDKRVYAFAPSSQASHEVLKKEGFKDAETLAMLLKNEKLQEKVKGQILWLDEAGLVSAKDMRALFDIAKKNGNRVIVSGDYTQHSSVEAGDAFRLMEKEAGVKLAKLKEVRRQTEPGYKKAVEQISEGTGKMAQKGFDALDRMGSVIEADGEERHAMLVSDYLKARDEGASALIISPTHSEGQKLTEELRTALKERGQIGKEQDFKTWKSTSWTDAQKGDIRNYEAGMVVEFNQNSKGFKRGEKAVIAQDDSGVYLQKTDGGRVSIPTAQVDRFDVYRVRDTRIGERDQIRITKNGEAKVKGQAKGTRLYNGDIYTVEGITKEGDLRLPNGKLIPKDWGHMTMGYVDTSYASQGKTRDRVFISVGDESLAATNKQQWYVSVSRGKEQAKIYVDSKKDVRNAIAQGGERLSAVELTGHKLKEDWRTRFYKSLERNRISRFVKERAAALADRWRGREGVSYA
jgi:conjugative relaxase-like TrwC/TraI family protein